MRLVNSKVSCHPMRSFGIFSPPLEDLCPTLRATDYKCPIIVIETYEDGQDDMPEQQG